MRSCSFSTSATWWLRSWLRCSPSRSARWGWSTGNWDSDLRVSEISLGSWLTYGVGVERDQAEACVRRAFEVGINFIDTANVYGRGAAESFLGEVLAAVDRASYVLATKVFFPMSRPTRASRAAQIRKQFDASLKRLRTDHVDLYQCHRYDSDTPLEETMEALTEAVRAGQGSLHRLQRVDARPDPGRPRPAGRRRNVRLEPAAVLDALAPARAGGHPAVRGQRHRPDRVVAAGPGRAHGQVPAGRAAARRLARREREHGRDDGAYLRRPGARGGASGCGPSPTGAGLSMAQLALAWVLREPNVASAIIGATRPEQVDDERGGVRRRPRHRCAGRGRRGAGDVVVR